MIFWLAICQDWWTNGRTYEERCWNMTFCTSQAGSVVTLCRRGGQIYNPLVSNFLTISCTENHIVIFRTIAKVLQIYRRQFWYGFTLYKSDFAAVLSLSCNESDQTGQQWGDNKSGWRHSPLKGTEWEQRNFTVAWSWLTNSRPCTVGLLRVSRLITD